jgi:hypothetical protein
MAGMAFRYVWDLPERRPETARKIYAREKQKWEEGASSLRRSFIREACTSTQYVHTIREHPGCCWFSNGCTGCGRGRILWRPRKQVSQTSLILALRVVVVLSLRTGRMGDKR